MAIIERLEKVSEEDVEDLNALLSELSSQPSEFLPITLSWLQSTIQDEKTAVVVSRENGRINGTATLVMMRRLYGDGAFIESVVVDEKYRGKGIGEAILIKLIEIARKKKIFVVGLTSRPSRNAANHLYQKLGFKLKETNVYQMRL